MKKEHKNKSYLAILASIAMLVITSSCAKETTLADDPYAGGKKVLDIEFVSKTIDPEVVPVGATINILVDGLEKYKDQFKVYVNEVEAEVINFTDSTLQFQVPLSASTGSMWITADEQVFFGPIVRIGGKVSIDESFNAGSGAGRVNNSNGATTIYDLELKSDGNMWLGGAFNNFNNQGTENRPDGGLAEINASGGYVDRKGLTNGFGKGVIGGNQTVYSIVRIPSGDHVNKFIIGGSFTGFTSNRPNRQVLNNLAMLGTNGFLDTVVNNDIVNPKPEQVWKNLDTVPRFNAGVDGIVRKTLIFGDKLYVLGNFQIFKRIYYPNSTFDEKVYDETRMRQMVRVSINDGSLDSTFHYNKATRQSAMGANGVINDAILQDDGKLILVGSFTSFNGTPAERIVRLNLDGSVDETFGAYGSGKGANADIYSIRYNSTTQKIVVSGSFNSFAGKSTSGVALLDSHGSLEDTFQPKQFTGGIVTYAFQLNSGKIIVTGGFNKYGSIVRQGFAILESNGELAEGYNNTGGFEGRIYDAYESPISGGSRVTMVGDIYRFNAIFPRNIVRINIAN